MADAAATAVAWVVWGEEAAVAMVEVVLAPVAVEAAEGMEAAAKGKET